MPQAQQYNILVDADGNIATALLAPLKRADLDATSSGNTQLVAAVTGKKIRVVEVLVTNKDSSTVTTKFQSATTDITAAHMSAASGGGYTRVAPENGWLFETAVGEALNFNLGGAGSVGCDVGYREV